MCRLLKPFSHRPHQFVKVTHFCFSDTVYISDNVLHGVMVCVFVIYVEYLYLCTDISGMAGFNIDPVYLTKTDKSSELQIQHNQNQSVCTIKVCGCLTVICCHNNLNKLLFAF